jgi:hypothetical protein
MTASAPAAANRSSQSPFRPGTERLAAPFRIRGAQAMEFEIEEGEELLFDKSTNPSLLHERRPARAAPAPSWRHPRDRHPPQRAVVIPEEETQPS